MKRYAAISLVALFFAGASCQGQILQKLEQGLLGGGQQQGMMPGQQPQPQFVGNVNLPPGQYMMTNTQTGQGFYVAVQNGQMYLTNQQMAPQMMAPGQGMMQPGQGMMQPEQGMMSQQQQQSGMGGFVRNGLGNFLKNEMTPQQVPGQVPGQ